MRCLPEAVQIRFVAGYGAAAAVPEDIKEAMLLIIGHLYAHREENHDFELYEMPLGALRLALALPDHEVRLMRAGAMRHQVTLQQPGAAARDSYGGDVTPWTTVATVWAELDPYHLRDRLTERRRNGEVVIGLRVRLPQARADRPSRGV